MSEEQEVLHEREDYHKSNNGLQIVVYPALIAFVILATYGFFLIFSLTRDMAVMAENVASMTESVNQNMQIIAREMVKMSGKMETMSEMTPAILSMNDKISLMQQDMMQMRQEIRRIGQSVGLMVDSTSSMAMILPELRGDVWSISNSIYNLSRPVNMFSSFLPANQTYAPRPTYQVLPPP